MQFDDRAKQRKRQASRDFMARLQKCAAANPVVAEFIVEMIKYKVDDVLARDADDDMAVWTPHWLPSAARKIWREVISAKR